MFGFKRKKREELPSKITIRQFIDEGYSNLVSIQACKVYYKGKKVLNASCVGLHCRLECLECDVLIEGLTPAEKLLVFWRDKDGNYNLFDGGWGLR